MSSKILYQSTMSFEGLKMCYFGFTVIISRNLKVKIQVGKSSIPIFGLVKILNLNIDILDLEEFL